MFLENNPVTMMSQIDDAAVQAMRLTCDGATTMMAKKKKKAIASDNRKYKHY